MPNLGLCASHQSAVGFRLPVGYSSASSWSKRLTPLTMSSPPHRHILGHQGKAPAADCPLLALAADRSQRVLLACLLDECIPTLR